MKQYNIFKISTLIVVAFALLCLNGCKGKQKSQSTPQERFKIEAIENISGSNDTHWVITLRVRNDYGLSPLLKQGEGDIYYDGTKTAHISLVEPVEIPKKSTSSIALPVSISILNPLKALALLMNLSKQNFDNIDISLRASVRAFGMERDINIERAELNALLKKLGYTNNNNTML